MTMHSIPARATLLLTLTCLLGLAMGGCPQDPDVDGVSDPADHSPASANPDQADSDAGGVGDAGTETTPQLVHQELIGPVAFDGGLNAFTSVFEIDPAQSFDVVVTDSGGVPTLFMLFADDGELNPADRVAIEPVFVDGEPVGGAFGLVVAPETVRVPIKILVGQSGAFGVYPEDGRVVLAFGLSGASAAGVPEPRNITVEVYL